MIPHDPKACAENPFRIGLARDITIPPRLALCLLCLAATAFTSAASAQSAVGVGARDCSAFEFALEQDSEDALDSYVAWSQGFISGFNWSNVRRRNVQVDPAGIINWLGSFCAGNPDAHIYNAVQELIRLNAR